VIAYKGEELTYTQYAERYQLDEQGRPTIPCEYTVCINSNRYLDARDPGPGRDARYINSKPIGSANLRLNQVGHFYTTRSIETGQELFFPYGADFKFQAAHQVSASPSNSTLPSSSSSPSPHSLSSSSSSSSAATPNPQKTGTALHLLPLPPIPIPDPPQTSDLTGAGTVTRLPQIPTSLRHPLANSGHAVSPSTRQ